MELAVLAGAALSVRSNANEPTLDAVVSALSVVTPSLQGARHCAAVSEIEKEVRVRLLKWSQQLRLGFSRQWP